MKKNESIKCLLEEIERVVIKFPKCKGVGYVIQPLLIKLAKESKLNGYDYAYKVLCQNGVSYMVGEIKKPTKNRGYIYIGWDGIKNDGYDGIWTSDDKKIIYVGIKDTIEKIKQKINSRVLTRK